jgi:hypothetical protein
MSAAMTAQQPSTRPTEKMPLDVLARTCDSFLQLEHVAGEERLDQRTAELETALALHQGHLCMRFNYRYIPQNCGITWQRVK